MNSWGSTCSSNRIGCFPSRSRSPSRSPRSSSRYCIGRTRLLRPPSGIAAERGAAPRPVGPSRRPRLSFRFRFFAFSRAKALYPVRAQIHVIGYVRPLQVGPAGRDHYPVTDAEGDFPVRVFPSLEHLGEGQGLPPLLDLIRKGDEGSRDFHRQRRLRLRGFPGDYEGQPAGLGIPAHDLRPDHPGIVPGFRRVLTTRQN